MVRFHHDYGRPSLLHRERHKGLNGYACPVNNQPRVHAWLSVINPISQRSLLCACDNCGVVKSENSIIRSCEAEPGGALISSSFSANTKIAV